MPSATVRKPLMPQLADPSRVPVADEATLNGCFETMRAYGGRIFRLEPHLDRLYASAKYLGLVPPKDRRLLARQLTRALASSRLSEAVVRVALMPRGRQPASPNIVVWPAHVLPAAMYRRGIRIAVVPARKFSVGAVDPQSKYSARLGSVLAVLDAQLRGVDEALFMDAVDGVTESTASNFGIVRDGVILTPPCYLGLLAGITRDVLFELAQALHIPIQETRLTRHDVYNAHEAFLSSTLKDYLPVTMVDGRRIGTGYGGPITGRLNRAFRQLVRKECHGPTTRRSRR